MNEHQLDVTKDQRDHLWSVIVSAFQGTGMVSTQTMAEKNGGALAALGVSHVSPERAEELATHLEEYLFENGRHPRLAGDPLRWYQNPVEFAEEILCVERELPNSCPTCRPNLLVNTEYPYLHPAGMIRQWEMTGGKRNGIPPPEEIPPCPECKGTKQRQDGRIDSAALAVQTKRNSGWQWGMMLNHGKPDPGEKTPHGAALCGNEACIPDEPI